MLCALLRARRLEVPADKIKSIPYGTEPSPAGSRSPREVVLRGRMNGPGDEEDLDRGTREAGRMWCEQRVVQCHRQAALLPYLGLG